MTTTQIVNWLSANIINPILYILFAAAIIVFMVGIIQFITGLSSNANDRVAEGKRHMLYGLFGLFIMVTTITIINLVVNTFAPGCFPPQGTNCSNSSALPSGQ